MNILVIEDSANLRRSLLVGLSNLGFTVTVTGDGAEGLSMALYHSYDLIILDLMLPSVDGLTILKTIRQSGLNTKVIILSAKVHTEDRIKGLLTGADDYMIKPFSFDELHARILAISRRGKAEYTNNQIKIGELCLDTAQQQFYCQENKIELTKNEYKIIEAIFSSPNNIISSTQISEAVIGPFDYLSKNTIESHLSSVRKKCKDVGVVLPIKNKRGFGYYIEAL